MIKRKFGMKTLNISQGRYGSYSHKYLNAYDLTGEDTGIDKFTAYYPFIVIAVHKFNHVNGTGFANTVHFYDDENDITIAMTHMNDVSRFTVGKRVLKDEIMYLEGTAGKATGNHIHMEIGKGRQPKKYQINGKWQLKDLINIEDYFYLDETHIIKKTQGYNFEIRYSNAEKIESEVQEMLSGKHEFIEQGLEILLYAQKENQKLGMISASTDNSDYKALKTIDTIDDDRVHYVKVNANYFQMGGAENGQHYGVEITPQTELIPRQKEWLVLWVDKGKQEIKYDFSSNFYLTKNDVEFACSPYAVLLHDGKDCSAVSTACGNKKSVKNTQTFLIQLKSMQVILGIVKNKCYPKNVLDWAKSKFKDDLIHLSLFDSGGSTQMIVNGKKEHFTARAISNVLTLYKVVTKTVFNKTVSENVNNVVKPKEKTNEDVLREEIEQFKLKIKEYNDIVYKQNEEIRMLEQSNKTYKDLLKEIKEYILKFLKEI